MLRNNADVRRCSYFELGLPVAEVTLDRLSIARTARGLRQKVNMRFKLRNFQNEKRADKNSSKQFLRIELA